MSGTLYGLGVGPGDPELMTLKAARILSSVSVVAYPAPDSGESFARAIAAEHIDKNAEEISILVPMRPDKFPHEIYAEAAQRIAKRLHQGQDVAVLCEGDPFFYGSFMYLYDLLIEEFPCVVIPGVSSLTACAAVAGRPLAGRNSLLSVIPGPLDSETISAQLNTCEAAAIMKVGRHFKRLYKLVEDEGLLERAVYVERATLSEQRVLPLADVPQDRAPYFSMILIDKGSRPNGPKSVVT
ncbi:MAG: precorrin-2 C(20)-methyltransferase [Hyphomicrobiales bacterium]|uniref:precorrin-2 C(20)-methyltransferase n=1 Tax=Nisaea sp. TaxID=2024842 RepID=UPI00326E2CC3